MRPVVFRVVGFVFSVVATAVIMFAWLLHDWGLMACFAGVQVLAVLLALFPGEG